MAYAEEPCYRDCRVVYSVSPNSLTFSTGDRAGQIVEYRNANGQCFSDIGTNLTPNDVLKLAVKFSDGVTFTAPNPEVEEYAKILGKPIMQYEATEENYIHFFDEIWSKDRKIIIED